MLQTAGVKADGYTDPLKAIEAAQLAREKGRPYALAFVTHRMQTEYGRDVIGALRAEEDGKTAIFLVNEHSWETLDSDLTLSQVDRIVTLPLYAGNVAWTIHHVLNVREGLAALKPDGH
ncbi:MAG: hypothetical protein IJ088_07305 [Clostridia bacterium]|nr:hypothetical protein [Clostridia bacterium]